MGGALLHINTEVRLDLPLWKLGPLPLLTLGGSEPLGDLPLPLVSPSGWGPGLFGKRDGCSVSVAMDTEGSSLLYVWGWHSKDNSCLPLAFSIFL